MKIDLDKYDLLIKSHALLGIPVLAPTGSETFGSVTSIDLTQKMLMLYATFLLSTIGNEVLKNIVLVHFKV